MHYPSCAMCISAAPSGRITHPADKSSIHCHTETSAYAEGFVLQFLESFLRTLSMQPKAILLMSLCLTKMTSHWAWDLEHTLVLLAIIKQQWLIYSFGSVLVSANSYSAHFLTSSLAEQGFQQMKCVHCACSFIRATAN
jgi:hypothetical protein